MLRKIQFVPGEYYHIYSRIILNTPKFKETGNAEKLIQAFLLSNSTTSGKAFDYLRTSDNPQLEKAIEISKGGQRFVDVLCYVVMFDHYHLLLKELIEGGITAFTRRCNTSISKYVNQKEERIGPLFESRFKAKHVESNQYLRHLSLYIHLNPLDVLIGKEWRENKLKDWPSAREKLLSYQWSSLKSYLYANHKDPIVSGVEVILDQFESREEYELFLQEWAEPISPVDKLKDFLID